LTLYQRTQLELMAPRIEQLTAVLKDGAALPDAEARELEALLDRSVRMVLDAPDVVHRKLSDVARASILNAFFALRSPKETGTGTPTQSPPTGLRSSRDSSGSTAALQTVG
jgi:hypothetical protein